MVFRTCQIHVLFSKRLNDRRSTSQRDRWERHHGFDCLDRAGGSWQWHARSKSHLPLNRYVATSPNGPNAKHRKIAAAATTNCIPKPYQETLSFQRSTPVPSFTFAFCPTTPTIGPGFGRRNSPALRQSHHGLYQHQCESEPEMLWQFLLIISMAFPAFFSV